MLRLKGLVADSAWSLRQKRSRAVATLEDDGNDTTKGAVGRVTQEKDVVVEAGPGGVTVRLKSARSIVGTIPWDRIVLHAYDHTIAGLARVHGLDQETLDRQGRRRARAGR